MTQKPDKFDWLSFSKLSVYILFTISGVAAAGAWRLRGDISVQENRITHVESQLDSTKDTLSHQVPREEYMAKWDDDRRRYDDLMKRLDEIRGDIKDLKSEVRTGNLAKKDKP